MTGTLYRSTGGKKPRRNRTQPIWPVVSLTVGSVLLVSALIAVFALVVYEKDLLRDPMLAELGMQVRQVRLDKVAVT